MLEPESGLYRSYLNSIAPDTLDTQALAQVYVGADAIPAPSARLTPERLALPVAAPGPTRHLRQRQPFFRVREEPRRIG